MTNQKYLDNLPIGEVVSFGQVLFAMKKRGLIEDYNSYFKYLEGNSWEQEDFEFMGHFFTRKYFDGCFKPYLIKDLPPMRWDKKTKKYYPKKRIYYKCFRANFKRKKLGDDLAKNCWNLHYKAQKKTNFDSALWNYTCKKSGMFKDIVREYIPVKNHSICLWGAII